MRGRALNWRAGAHSLALIPEAPKSFGFSCAEDILVAAAAAVSPFRTPTFYFYAVTKIFGNLFLVTILLPRCVWILGESRFTRSLTITSEIVDSMPTSAN